MASVWLQRHENASSLRRKEGGFWLQEVVICTAVSPEPERGLQEIDVCSLRLQMIYIGFTTPNSVHVSTASGDGAACVAGAALICCVDQSLTGVDRSLTGESLRRGRSTCAGWRVRFSTSRFYIKPKKVGSTSSSKAATALL